MRRFGYSAMFVGCAAALLLAAAALPLAAEETDSQVELRWALGAKQAGTDAPVAVTKDTRLESGTQLKFMVEPLSAGSVYLILLDAEDAIQVLYRNRSEAYPGKAYMPPEPHWFELEHEPGRETFFLLASADPLEDLDQLLDQHEQDGDSGDLGDAIVGEIRRLQKANRNFARSMEEPVTIGGRTRDSSGDSIDQLATQVSAEGFFAKTITIDH